MDNTIEQDREDFILEAHGFKLPVRTRDFPTPIEYNDAVRSYWNSMSRIEQMVFLQGCRRDDILYALRELDAFDAHLLSGDHPEDYISVGTEFEVLEFMADKYKEPTESEIPCKPAIETGRVVH